MVETLMRASKEPVCSYRLVVQLRRNETIYVISDRDLEIQKNEIAAVSYGQLDCRIRSRNNDIQCFSQAIRMMRDRAALVVFKGAGLDIVPRQASRCG